MPVAENPQMERIIDKRFIKDIQLKMPVGRMKKKFKSMDRPCKSS
jgi:hypothetical protein